LTNSGQASVEGEKQLFDFERLERDRAHLRDDFPTVRPFGYVVIDGLADPRRLPPLVDEIPDPHEAVISAGSALVRAKNRLFGSATAKNE